MVSAHSAISEPHFTLHQECHDIYSLILKRQKRMYIARCDIFQIHQSVSECIFLCLSFCVTMCVECTYSSEVLQVTLFRYSREVFTQAAISWKVGTWTWVQSTTPSPY